MAIFSQLTLDQNIPTLTAADLGWTVHKEPLYTQDPIGTLEVTGQFALVRSDTRDFLSVVSDRYQPIQNSQVVDFFEQYTQEFGGSITHGGHFNSKNLVLYADLGKEIDLGQGHLANCGLMARTGHYPGAALQIMIGVIHIVCTNQFTFRGTGTENKGFYYQYHNLTFTDEAKATAHSTLAAAQAFIENYKTYAQALMNQEISDNFAKNFVIKFLGDESKTLDEQPTTVNNILNIYHSRNYIGVNDKEDPTAWRLWNSITQYLDHKSNNPNSRFGRSALIGRGQEIKHQTFNALLAEAA